jgi:hypothetical protein
MIKTQLQASHIKNLEWALRLSQTKFDDCKTGDLLNIKEELWEFTYWTFLELLRSVKNTTEGQKVHRIPRVFESGAVVGYETREDFVGNITEMDLSKIKSEFTAFFAQIAADVETNTVAAKDVSFSIYPIRNPSGPFVLHIKLKPFQYVEMARVALLEHFCGSGLVVEQIRFCPKCSLLFILKMKPRKDRNFYCSVNCSRNAASQAYRTRKGKSLKITEAHRNRSRYEKRIHKIHPRARIAKRTLKTH